MTATKKITDLIAADPFTGDEATEVVQGGNSRQAYARDYLNYSGTNATQTDLIINAKNGDEDNTGGSITVRGGHDNDGNGAGSVYVFGGNSLSGSGGGGDILLQAGDDTEQGSAGCQANFLAGQYNGRGGSFRVQCGNATVNGKFGGDITLVAGTSMDQAGSPATITGGAGDGNHKGGAASLTAGASTNGGTGGDCSISGGNGSIGGGNLYLDTGTGGGGQVIIGHNGPALPTADPHVLHAIWNNSGVLNISAG